MNGYVDFSRIKARLRQVQADWQRKVQNDLPDDALFFRTPFAQLQKHRSRASDNNAAKRMLKASFTLKDLEMLTYFRNSEIKARQNHLRAAIETIGQAAALDEILRRYSAFTEGLMPGIGPMKGKEPLKAKFPFPALLALKGQIAQQEIIAASESFEAVRRDMIAMARKTYWNLVFIDKSQQITRDTVDFLQQLETVANTRYKAGETSFQDVIKVEIRRKILEEELLTLRKKRRNLELTVLQLVDLPPDESVGSPRIEEPNWKIPSIRTLQERALKKRQELRRMIAMVGKMERMIAMTETMILPQYTFNFSVYSDEAVSQTGSGAMQETFATSVSASRGAGLPQKPWHGANNAFLRQTKQTLAALQNELAGAQKQTATMVQKAWYKTDQAKREAALFRNTVIGLARSALDVSVRGYESGRVPFADVIGSYTDWLQARLALARKLSDIGVARAELARVVGTHLNFD